MMIGGNEVVRILATDHLFLVLVGGQLVLWFQTLRSGFSRWKMNDTSEQPFPVAATEDRFATYRLIARYYVAFLVVFGMIGNGTCLIIYRRESLNRCRRVQYLTALAISDLVFLFCLGLMWLKGIGVQWQEMPGICTASIYVSNTASFLSGWYVMVLTAEMACVLRRPYHIVRTTAGSRLSVAKRIAGASLLGLLVNSWTLFVAESIPKPIEPEPTPEYYYYDDTANDTVSNETFVETEAYDQEPFVESAASKSIAYNCRIALNSKILYDAFTVMDMIASFSIPLVVTLVLNLYIGVTITRAARQRRFMSQDQILTRLRARAQSTAIVEPNITSPTSAALATKSTCNTASHQPLSKNDSGNSAGSAGGALRSALKNRDSGGRVLSEVATRLRRLALRQRLRAEATVSSLLVAKSLTYLMLNLPNYTHRVWMTLRPQPTTPSPGQSPNEQGQSGASVVNETEFLLQMIVYLTFYTQYALNFVIYSSNAFVRNVCNQRSRSSSIVIK